MNDYAGTLSRHRRLTILKFLADSPEYTSNASILVDVCNQFGVNSTHDQVAGDIAWLKEQDMAGFDDHGNIMVVTATDRGVEIARGKARHAGVQRPRPGL